jgi:Rrf2 family protein
MQSDFCVAVHALVCLAHTNEAWSSSKLAENIRTSSSRVRKVMASLTGAGLVTSREGVDGGYLLAKDSRSITLREVAELLGVQCVSLSWESGGTDPNCVISRGMGPKMRSIAQELDAKCKQFLQTVTIQSIDEELESSGERDGKQPVDHQ